MGFTKTSVSEKPLRFTWRVLAFAVLVNIGVLFASLSWVPNFINNVNIGMDWNIVFRPAIIAAFSGQSPYAVEGFFSPPWLLVALSPFALIPPPFDLIFVSLVNLAAFIFVLVKLKASPFVIVLFFLTPQLWYSILLGNIDSLVALGFVLSPPFGLIFLSLKPQMAIALVFFRGIELFRSGDVRGALIAFTPIGIIVAVSFIALGWWPARMGGAINKYWNISAWPYAIPIGLILLYKSLQSRKQGWL